MSEDGYADCADKNSDEIAPNPRRNAGEEFGVVFFILDSRGRFCCLIRECLDCEWYGVPNRRNRTRESKSLNLLSNQTGQSQMTLIIEYEELLTWRQKSQSLFFRYWSTKKITLSNVATVFFQIFQLLFCFHPLCNHSHTH